MKTRSTLVRPPFRKVFNIYSDCAHTGGWANRRQTNCRNHSYLDFRVAEVYCNEKPFATGLRNSGVLFKTGDSRFYGTRIRLRACKVRIARKREPSNT